MSSKTIWIGIDPDVEKSGVSVWKDGVLELYNLKFFELYSKLHFWIVGANVMNRPIKVRIEAGWLNKKTNWHDEKKGIRVASKIGSYVGANHEVGRKIAEMCEYFKVDYELCVPKSSKVDAATFKKITKYEGRTNPEQRDAGILVYGL